VSYEEGIKMASEACKLKRHHIKLSGLVPGQRNADLMGSYFEQREKVLGKPVYTHFGAGGVAYLFFDGAGGQKWVVGPKVGQVPFLLAVDSTAASAEDLVIRSSTVEMHEMIHDVRWTSFDPQAKDADPLASFMQRPGIAANINAECEAHQKLACFAGKWTHWTALETTCNACPQVGVV
jgi:hypothetical protein